jgi:hypothetical protein
MSNLSKKGTRKQPGKNQNALDKLTAPARELLKALTTGAAMPPKGQAMGGYMKRNDGGMAKKTRIF